MVNVNVSADPSQPSSPIHLDHSGYRVARVSTELEMLAVSRRRYMVFVEQMRALPENRQQLELDIFDQTAEHFYASLDGIVVGSMRAVRDSGRGFPMEADGVALPNWMPRGTSVESSRVNAASIIGHDILIDLIGNVLDWAQDLGLTHVLGVSHAHAIRSLQRRGWPFVTFGEPIDHAGVAYYPNYTCIAEAARAAA